MKAQNKNIYPLIGLLLTFFLTGCTIVRPPARDSSTNQSTKDTYSKPETKRFQTTQQPTAVESTIELTDKYTKLLKEASDLKVKINELTTENNRLKKNSLEFDEKLQQAQKELAEANDLLVKMSIELNNWKVDVLGFRDEMRDAQKAQLEALHKILVVLGGEIEEESVGSETKDSNSPKTKEQNKTKKQ